MGLIDKIRNTALQRKINKQIQERRIKDFVTPEQVITTIVEETMNNKVLVEGTKTLQRIGILETASTWSVTQILDHESDILRSENRIDRIEKILEQTPETLKADTVLDTSDNTYKDVKHITVNHASKSDRVLWPDTREYYTVDKLPIYQNFLPTTGGTITGGLDVLNGLTSNGEIVATQQWVLENAGSGGSSGDWRPTTDQLRRDLNKEISDRINSDDKFDNEINRLDTKIDRDTSELGNSLNQTTNELRQLETKLEEWTNAVKFVHIEGNDINWSADRTYGVGALSKHDNLIFLSLQNNNKGHVPSLEDNDWWVDFGLVAQSVDLSDYYTKSEITRLLSTYATQDWVSQQLAQLSGIEIKELKQQKTENFSSGWKSVDFQFDIPEDFDFNSTKYWTEIHAGGDIVVIADRDIWISDNKLIVSVGVNAKGNYQHKVTCKLYYIVGTGGIGGSGSAIDTSKFVTKDETLENLCKVEECAWAQDIVSQIESNASAISNIEKQLGGVGQEKRDILFATTKQISIELTDQELNGNFYYYDFEYDISEWDNNEYNLEGVMFKSIHKDSIVGYSGEVEPSLRKKTLITISFDENMLYGTIQTAKMLDTTTGKFKLQVTCLWKKVLNTTGVK